MSLPYRYELLIRVEIKGDGIEAGGDGAKATATRLAALLETDSHVISADPWPGIEYKGKHFEPEPEPKDGDEREEPWGSGAPGTSTHMMPTCRSVTPRDVETGVPPMNAALRVIRAIVLTLRFVGRWVLMFAAH